MTTILIVWNLTSQMGDRKSMPSNLAFLIIVSMILGLIDSGGIYFAYQYFFTSGLTLHEILMHGPSNPMIPNWYVQFMAIGTFMQALIIACVILWIIVKIIQRADREWKDANNVE